MDAVVTPENLRNFVLVIAVDLSDVRRDLLTQTFRTHPLQHQLDKSCPGRPNLLILRWNTCMIRRLESSLRTRFLPARQSDHLKRAGSA